jgi:hypothetical protein
MALKAYKNLSENMHRKRTIQETLAWMEDTIMDFKEI